MALLSRRPARREGHLRERLGCGGADTVEERGALMGLGAGGRGRASAGTPCGVLRSRAERGGMGVEAIQTQGTCEGRQDSRKQI